MTRSFCILVICISIFQAVTFSKTSYAAAQITCSAKNMSSASKNIPLFRYENGKLDVDVNKVPLGIILERFKTDLGLQAKLYDPSMVCSPVSIVLKDRPQEDAIKAILKRISYVLYRKGNRIVVVVLSNDVFTRETHEKIKDESESAQQTVALAGQNALQEPKTLNEFQPITAESLSLDNIGEDTDPDEKIKAERKYQEALLQRAIAAINSPYEHLRKEATSQLIDINNPVATEILIDAARTGTGSITRVQAVDALRQHLENIQYNDTASIQALVDLAEDSDHTISKIAQQALLDTDNFQTENWSMNNEYP